VPLLVPAVLLLLLPPALMMGLVRLIGLPAPFLLLALLLLPVGLLLRSASRRLATSGRTPAAGEGRQHTTAQRNMASEQSAGVLQVDSWWQKHFLHQLYHKGSTTPPPLLLAAGRSSLNRSSVPCNVQANSRPPLLQRSSAKRLPSYGDTGQTITASLLATRTHS
jgi:hypothetical protein